MKKKNKDNKWEYKKKRTQYVQPTLKISHIAQIIDSDFMIQIFLTLVHLCRVGGIPSASITCKTVFLRLDRSVLYRSCAKSRNGRLHDLDVLSVDDLDDLDGLSADDLDDLSVDDLEDTCVDDLP